MSRSVSHGFHFLSNAILDVDCPAALVNQSKQIGDVQLTYKATGCVPGAVICILDLLEANRVEVSL